MFSGAGNPVGNGQNTVGSPHRASRWGWLRPFPALLLLSWAAAGTPLELPGPVEEPEVSVTRVLASDFGLSASPSDVAFLDPPPPVTAPYRTSRAWVIAGDPDAPDDVYLAHVRRAPEGGLLDVDSVYNLTETRTANERYLAASGELAVVALGENGHDYSVHLFDAGRGPALPVDLGSLPRWQLRLEWLQETGQLEGVARRVFKLDPPVARLQATVAEGGVTLEAEGVRAVIPRQDPPREGGFFLDERPQRIARPGNLTTWAVDRVRALPWFGDERMQLLKLVAYRALDVLRTSLGGLPGVSSDAPALDLGLPAGVPNALPALAREPERDWPPADLVPVLDPPLPDEGRWLAPDADPFVRPLSDGSPPVLVSFVRTDPDREFSRVVLVLWDSHVVELSMQGGTEEPKSSTGETSTGLIPRDPELLGRVIGAFNGGFQSTHGEFGIMIDGTVLVPPAPYSATIARLDDGNTGFGTWPADTTIPEGLRSFRQNLTPLVQDGKFNPYGRLFWGGAPEDWEDRTRTVRSGLCLTPAGHVVYLYGASIDHGGLARAMQLASCDYGVHLDMNQGHTGLEFYRIAPGAELPTLGLPLDGMWQAEGDVEEAPGLRFRGRRLFKTMQLMNFPRYIQREARDFFYFAEKRLLPGPPLATGSDGRWTRTGLPEERYPYALSRSTFRPEPERRPDTKVHALELDPSLLAMGDEAAPLFSVVPSGDGPMQLVWTAAGRFELVQESQGREATVIASGSEQVGPGAVAGLGLRGRFLLYVEVATGKRPETDAALLTGVLRDAGCDRVLLLREPLGWILEQGRDLSGHPLEASRPSLHFGKVLTSRARRIFTETPTVERSVWRPLQRRPPP